MPIRRPVYQPATIDQSWYAITIPVSFLATQTVVLRPMGPLRQGPQELHLLIPECSLGKPSINSRQTYDHTTLPYLTHSTPVETLATPQFKQTNASDELTLPPLTSNWLKAATSNLNYNGAVLLQSLVACKLCLIRPGKSLGCKIGCPTCFPPSFG